MGFSTTRGTIAALALLSLAALPQVAQADTLTTIFTAGNGSSGNQFDLTATQQVTITALDINVNSGTSGLLHVYTRNGTWVGNTTNTAAWTYWGSASYTSAGSDVPTPVDIPDLTLNTGLTGITIFASGGGIRYTNGNGSNQDYSSAGGVLSLSAGSGGTISGTPGSGTETFSMVNIPRVWNGNIHFTASASVAPEPGTLALVALGIVGGAVARRRK